jgi:hypothetical protein
MDKRRGPGPKAGTSSTRPKDNHAKPHALSETDGTRSRYLCMLFIMPHVPFLTGVGMCLLQKSISTGSSATDNRSPNRLWTQSRTCVIIH